MERDAFWKSKLRVRVSRHYLSFVFGVFGVEVFFVQGFGRMEEVFEDGTSGPCAWWFCQVLHCES